jgi:hypothetical protein
VTLPDDMHIHRAGEIDAFGDAESRLAPITARPRV